MRRDQGGRQGRGLNRTNCRRQHAFGDCIHYTNCVSLNGRAWNISRARQEQSREKQRALPEKRSKLGSTDSRSPQLDERRQSPTAAVLRCESRAELAEASFSIGELPAQRFVPGPERSRCVGVLSGITSLGRSVIRCFNGLAEPLRLGVQALQSRSCVAALSAESARRAQLRRVARTARNACHERRIHGVRRHRCRAVW